ncbi:unnamed protein product [Lactuca saligna]|uniref:Uncharacterized protein n=1 Tax=Lactuca saligna TaxID=75948 RepID=A0AA35VL81_LACSI|nr:unnamed protein product [Lactuca saligna]
MVIDYKRQLFQKMNDNHFQGQPLTTAVMGHGGDGGDEPPHPFDANFGVHQIDSLDKNTWKEVPEADRNGMFTYLSTYFDFQAISNDLDARILWASLNHRICLRYRGSKNIAKGKFIDMLEGVEAARARSPCINNLCEMQNTLVYEVSLQTQYIADSGGDPNSIDWISLFEKVLGAQRGHDVDVNAFLQNPVFVMANEDIIRSFSKQVDNATNNDEENDDRDDD